jgi:hypothetical protein
MILSYIYSKGEALRRSSALGVALAFLLLFFTVLIFEVRLPDANALVLFSDDFANLNELNVINGVWNPSGSLLSGTASTGEALVWTGDISWMYYQATANLRVINPGGEAGLVVRYTNPFNFYLFGLGSFGHKYSISRVVDGVFEELAFSGLYSEIEAGKWYTVSAVVVCGSLQLYVDGVKVLEVLDYSHPKGAVGFRVWQDTMQVGQLVVQSLGWSQTYGGASNEYAYSIIQTSDGGYAMGTGHSFVKTDSVGNIEWSRTYRGTNNALWVIQTFDGGYALAGTNQSDPPPGIAPNTEFSLVKTDSAGNEQWRRVYGGHNNQYASCVIQTSDGGYAIVGVTYAAGPGNGWFVKTDFEGNIEWDRTYGLIEIAGWSSVIQTSDGGYALTGMISDSFGTAGIDAWLVKTDSNGNTQWSRTYGETNNDIAYKVIQTSDGGYALAGVTNLYGAEGSDAWLVKIDSIGNTQWSRTYGGAGNDDLRSIIPTSDGGYALGGTTDSYGAGGSDAWFIKTDLIGNIEWNRTYGGIENDDLRSIIPTSDGGYALAGSTTSYGAGGSDAWFIKVPADSPPQTIHDYDDLWHTSDFTIGLSAIDDFTSVSQIYYRINDGAIKTINDNGQPLISTEGANNKLEYWSIDSLGHEDLSHKFLTGIKLDKTPPTCSITINGGDASTTSTSVFLTLTANDLTSMVSQVRYSNDGVWDTESWESYLMTKTWTLTDGEGIKTVYYQVKDNAGLHSYTQTDTIILEAPSLTPSPTPTPITTPTSTPSASPNPNPSSTPNPNQTQTPSPSPDSQPTQTPLYIYAIVVFAITVISVAALTFIKKKIIVKK